MMDDLASELQLRRLEPPYRDIEQELADRFTHMKEPERKERMREVVQQIYDFMRESGRRSTRY